MSAVGAPCLCNAIAHAGQVPTDRSHRMATETSALEDFDVKRLKKNDKIYLLSKGPIV